MGNLLCINKSLRKAASKGKTSRCLQLLKQGAEVNKHDGSHKRTPLHEAAIGGHDDTVRLLLDNGANIESQSNKMWTPLHEAAIRGLAETVTTLLDFGANVDSRNNKNETPLQWAATKNHKDATIQLLENGADRNLLQCESIDDEMRTFITGYKQPKPSKKTTAVKLYQNTKDKHSTDTLNQYVSKEDSKFSTTDALDHAGGVKQPKPTEKSAKPKSTADKLRLNAKDNQSTETSDMDDFTEDFGNAVDMKMTKHQFNFYFNKIAPSVCRIHNTITGVENGTGFLIGRLDTKQSNTRSFILTCFHLGIQNIQVNTFTAQFGYISSGDNKVEVEITKIITYNKTLDYTLLEVESTDQLAKFATEGLGKNIYSKSERPKHPTRFILLGHEGGKPLTLDNSAYIPKDYTPQPSKPEEVYLYYQSSSFKGSSGSPCLSRENNILHAMHCGGTKGARSTIEYGVWLPQVVKDIKQKISSLKELKLEELDQLFPNCKEN